MMLLVRFQDVVLDIRNRFAHRRIHTFVLDVGVNRQRLDDLGDDVGLGFGRIRAGLPKVVEQLFDRLVSSFRMTIASVDIRISSGR